MRPCGDPVGTFTMGGSTWFYSRYRNKPIVLELLWKPKGSELPKDLKTKLKRWDLYLCHFLFVLLLLDLGAQAWPPLTAGSFLDFIPWGPGIYTSLQPLHQTYFVYTFPSARWCSPQGFIQSGKQEIIVRKEFPESWISDLVLTILPGGELHSQLSPGHRGSGIYIFWSVLSLDFPFQLLRTFTDLFTQWITFLAPRFHVSPQKSHTPSDTCELVESRLW